MNKNDTDSQLFRAIAEVVVNGYNDEYGTHYSPIDKVIKGFKPSEDFLKRVEEKIDTSLLADVIADKITHMVNYNREILRESLMKRAKEIAAEKIAEKMIADNEFNK